MCSKARGKPNQTKQSEAAKTELCVIAAGSLQLPDCPASAGCRLFELRFLSIPESSRHIHLDDQLIHPKDLAVDLFKPDIVEPKLIEPIEFLLRKEVIQPQVPLRLPCYDFIPVTAHSVGRCLHCWLARALRLQVTSMM